MLKIISIHKTHRILILLLGLALAGCGGSDSTATVVTPPNPVVPVDPVDPVDPEPTSDKPNILLIIADDQGIDSSADYSFTQDPPTTPNISELAAKGLVFDNNWATPTCAPTRAAIITGKHGVNTGVLSVPGDLDDEEETIFEFLAANENTQDYASALFGKWHLGGANTSETDPIDNGVPYFAGTLQGGINNYNRWDLTTVSIDSSVETVRSLEYNTSKLTELATDWIGAQDSPWFVWLAYSSPHSPFHWPDEALHTRTGQTETTCANASTNDNEAVLRECYLAMIEAMDTEIGNLLNSMTDEERANTIVIYVGDNGTPVQVRDASLLGADQAKASLHEGGVRTPLIISGFGVGREGERETRMVSVTDLYATIAELAGSDVHSVNDSISLVDYFSHNAGEDRTHTYADYSSNRVDGWTIRNHTHQLIHDHDEETLHALSPNTLGNVDVTNIASEELYELQVEGAEIRGELGNLVAYPQGEALDITHGGDHGIMNIRASTCARFVKEYTASAYDIFGTASESDDVLLISNVSISVENGECIVESNNIPNHNFQDTATFPANNVTSEQNFVYRIPAAPKFADAVTPLDVSNEQGFFINGVKIDIFAAACLGFGDERTQCGRNADLGTNEWRFDPMFEANGFSTDSHNAHTQPNGAYHYHGNPNALFTQSASEESGVIGFAADGFPIFGSYVNDKGQIRKVTSSYQLKAGDRPIIDVGGSSANYSQRPYNGAFRQDYEYVEGSGDLDECNGMTYGGIYGYYVTDGFPYVVGCHKGTRENNWFNGGQ